MTAICLLWRFEGVSDIRDDAGSMLSALRPYGADHQALWADGQVGMGRALYRTLPEDAYDRQPLSVAGGTAVLVADARLDNRDELAGLLDISTTDRAIMSDTDILVRAWERWGDDCVPRLLGDFAFIVWDARNQRVFCARDPLGRRPLHYHRGKDFLAIASMPKGLLALADVPKVVDDQLLGAFLAVMPTTGEDNPFGPRSFYKEIERLPPASRLVATRDDVKVDRYWSTDEIKPVHYAKDGDYLERANELFDRAVSARLRSNGKIASHISSGLDSSSVTVTAARLLAARDERLIAFTAVPRTGHAPAPKGKHADEGPLAAEAASRFPNIEHVRVPYPLASAMTAVERNLYVSDGPLLNACNKAWVDEIGMAAAKRGVRAMLYAPMGNATISYVGLERFNQLLRTGQLLTWAREVLIFSGRQANPWAAFRRNVLLAMPSRLRQDVFALFRARGTNLSTFSPMSSGFLEENDLDENRSERLKTWHDKRVERGWRARMIDFVDPGTIVAGAIAQFGHELRDPTSDRHFLEFCLGAPLDQFYRDGQDKRLVRRMMRDVLPADMLDGPTQGYQGVGWLENVQLARDEILAEIQSMRTSPLGSRILDLDKLESLANSIPGEGAETPIVINKYRLKLLRGVGVARFIRYAEGGNG